MTTTAEDLWLAEHTIECQPFAARISPAVCATQQEKGYRGCPCSNRVTGVAPLPVKRKRHPRGLMQWILTGNKLPGIDLGPESDENDELPEAAQSKPKDKPRRAKRGENAYSSFFTGRKAQLPSADTETEEDIPAAPPRKQRRPYARRSARKPAPALSIEAQRLHAELDYLASLGRPSAVKLQAMLNDERRSA